MNSGDAKLNIKPISPFTRFPTRQCRYRPQCGSCALSRSDMNLVESRQNCLHARFVIALAAKVWRPVSEFSAFDCLR